jgi:aspartate/tyrosine/aromatic aminotransferase
MRERLFNKLVELKTPGEWKHIKSQIGMFSFTGLKPEQVDTLAEKAHIYLTRDGRISMAALNESNVEVCFFILLLGAIADECSTLLRAFPRLSRENYRCH